MIVCYKWGLTDAPFLEVNHVSYYVEMLDKLSRLIRILAGMSGVAVGGGSTPGGKMNIVNKKISDLEF
jgi:hypothetical protein